MEEAILQLEHKFTMEQDTIQINAPEFGLDIDGPNSSSAHNNTAVVSVQDLACPEPDISDAADFQEENTHRDLPKTKYNNLEESHGYDSPPQHIQNYTTEQCQITSGDSIDSEEIPQLEEDWDNGQFTDADTNLINRYNTHSESDKIRREYTQHLLDLSDNQYYYEENPINQLQHSRPDPDYYATPSRRLQTQPHDPNGYYPPPPDLVDVQCWYACGRGNAFFFMDIDFSEKRLDQLKAGKPEREDKTISNESES